MKKLLLMIYASLLLSACGAAGLGTSTPKLDVKIGGKQSTLEIKSSAVDYGNVISTSPGKPSIQTFNHSIVLANYEMDTTNLGTMKKPLTAPEQMRVMLSITGEEGTKDDSPFKVGTYSAKADKINSVRGVYLHTFADGKENKIDFDTMTSNKTIDGEVKITSVTAETISGEVNLTEGDKSIKGTFTAKLPKK